MMNDLETRTAVVLGPVAVSLVGAALLMLGSGFAAMFTFTGVPTRDRLFYGAQRGGGAFPLTLGLAAVVIAILCSRSTRREAPWIPWSTAGAIIVAVIAIAAAAYSIWYVLSLHATAPGPNLSPGVLFSFGEQAWAEKITEILHDAATILLGGVTLWAVRLARPARSDDREILPTT